MFFRIILYNTINKNLYVRTGLKRIICIILAFTINFNDYFEYLRLSTNANFTIFFMHVKINNNYMLTLALHFYII